MADQIIKHQTCVCANRVFVQEAAAESFTRLVAERAHQLREADAGGAVWRFQTVRLRTRRRD